MREKKYIWKMLEIKIFERWTRVAHFVAHSLAGKRHPGRGNLFSFPLILYFVFPYFAFTYFVFPYFLFLIHGGRIFFLFVLFYISHFVFLILIQGGGSFFFLYFLFNSLFCIFILYSFCISYPRRCCFPSIFKLFLFCVLWEIFDSSTSICICQL